MIRRNILANMIGRIWGFISVYLFVPLYLKFLGIEAYGLVGFYSTLLGVLVFADMGFTATLNREMARISVREGSIGEMRDLLRTYETVYAFSSLFVSILIWFLAPLIAEHWLRSNTLHPDEIATAIRLMGVAIAFQLPSGLFIGGLMGLQRQVQANCFQISWGLFRGIGAVLVLWLFSPTITMFAFWQLISNMIYCFCTRFSLWNALSVSTTQSRPQFKFQVFRNTWRYAAGMAGVASVSIILTQVDKLVVSKMLSLEMLGYYVLACALASAPVMLASPISSAVFPRLTGLVATGDQLALKQLYHRACELVAVAIIPSGLTIALFSDDLIFVWTGSVAASQHAGLVAIFLILGQLMQAAVNVPYYLVLAHGNTRFNIQIGIVSVILVTPLLIPLVMKYGLIGAGLSWLAMNICTLPPYMYFLHRRFLPGELRQWCLRSVGRPLLATLPCVLVGRWLVPVNSSRLSMFCLVGLVWGISMVTTVFSNAGLRNGLIENARNYFNVFPKKERYSNVKRVVR